MFVFVCNQKSRSAHLRDADSRPVQVFRCEDVSSSQSSAHHKVQFDPPDGLNRNKDEFRNILI